MTVTAIALALLPGGAIGLVPGLVGGGGSILALPLLVQCDRFRADPRGDWHGSGSGGRDGQCDGQSGESAKGGSGNRPVPACRGGEERWRPVGLKPAMGVNDTRLAVLFGLPMIGSASPSCASAAASTIRMPSIAPGAI